jgi:hypothetical protein
MRAQSVTESSDEALVTTTTLPSDRGTMVATRTYIAGAVPDTMLLRVLLRHVDGKETRVTRFFVRDGAKPPPLVAPTAVKAHG